MKGLLLVLLFHTVAASGEEFCFKSRTEAEMQRDKWHDLAEKMYFEYSDKEIVLDFFASKIESNCIHLRGERIILGRIRKDYKSLMLVKK